MLIYLYNFFQRHKLIKRKVKKRPRTGNGQSPCSRSFAYAGTKLLCSQTAFQRVTGGKRRGEKKITKKNKNSDK